MEQTNEIATVEYIGALDERVEPMDKVWVQLAIEPYDKEGHLKYILVDATPWNEDTRGRAVMKDTDGTTVLVVEPGQDRIFVFELDPRWKWKFDQQATPNGAVMTFKTREAAGPYRVNIVNDTTIEIVAKARPIGHAKTRDNFNLYVELDQGEGLPVKLRIDPGTDNPP